MILLVFLMALLVVPIRNIIISYAQTELENFQKLVYETTELNFTFDSLSPSVLSGVNVKNINFYDKDSNSVLSINKTKVKLKLSKLIKKDFQNGVYSIAGDGISLDIDGAINFALRMQEKFGMTIIEFDEIKKMIPANIKLKNVTLFYNKDSYNLSLLVKSASLSNSSRNESLEFHADALANASIPLLKQNLSAKLQLSAIITESLEGSLANIRLENLTDGDIKINRLSFLASYEKRKLEVRTVQSVNPIFIGAVYSIDSQDINIQAKADNLKPSSLVSINSKQKELERYKNIITDFDVILRYSLAEDNLNYFCDFSSTIPASVFSGGLEAATSFFGDKNHLEVTKINLSGLNLSATGNLDFNFENFQASGYIDIPYIILPTQSELSTEIFIEKGQKDRPNAKGFVIYAPSILLGMENISDFSLSVSPVQDSFDFILQASEYSHYENGMTGDIHAEGSYIISSNYIQSNITTTSLYADSIAKIALEFLEYNFGENEEKILSSLSPYVFSSDIYVSTDFKSFSYNIPYIIFANTKKENQVLMAGFDGNLENIQMNMFSLVLGSHTVQGTATLEKSPDSSDFFLSADMNADSIPYQFSLSVLSNVCTLSGDWGTEGEVRFTNNNLSGFFKTENLPFKISQSPLVIACDADFSMDKENGPFVSVKHFEVEKADSLYSVNPRLAFSAEVSKYGATLDSLVYSDIFSVLQGNASFLVNINDSIFDSANISLNLKNPLGDESVILDGFLSNPEKADFSFESALEKLYMNIMMSVNSLSLNRFTQLVNDDNAITGTLFASGTVRHPYLSLSIEKANILLSSQLMYLKGDLVLEDSSLSILDFSMKYADLTIDNIFADASIENMSLNARGNLSYELLGKKLFAPLSLSISDSYIPQGKFLPEAFTATLSASEFSGDLLKKNFPASFSLMYMDKNFNFWSSENIGLYGSYDSSEYLELSLDNKSFAAFKLDGLVNRFSANLALYDFSLDLNKAFSYLNLDELISIDKGLMGGDVILSGSFSNPDFFGSLSITNPSFKLPSIAKQNLSGSSINAVINHNEINFEPFQIHAKNNQRLELYLNVYLNKWIFENLDGRIKTVKKDDFPLFINTPILRLSGDISCDLNYAFEQNTLDVSGKIAGENVEIYSSVANTFTELTKTESKPFPIFVRSNVEVTIGSHSSIDFNPLLRCIFVPNTTVGVFVDMEDGVYSVDGSLKIKSGDVAYLSRSFYIKSGEIKFNPTELSNPILNLSAETREKDDSGQTVKITMNVDNQYLKDLSPTFSAIPAKSESEIRTMLGQIAIADASSPTGVIFAAGDYALQTVVIRQVENALRQVLNFDIFSVRTNVIQNTFNLRLSKNSVGNDRITLGNLFDNSTVYIGKYLGNSLYVDAMLHVTMDDKRINEYTNSGTLKFQPEFGLEMESPFANIRFNMAPDINALLNYQFVPSTSLTLSWKFAF